MKILKMRATFGKLQSAELALGEGLIIEAPNEGGKSTWSAFLRAMLYGINTEEWDRQGYLAEKNRISPGAARPWRGAWSCSGRVVRHPPPGGAQGEHPLWPLLGGVYRHGGAGARPHRGQRGETLTGVPRRYSSAPPSWARGARPSTAPPPWRPASPPGLQRGGGCALFQVERRLRDWLNRRKHNKTGLIPRLEEELADVEGTGPLVQGLPSGPGGQAGAGAAPGRAQTSGVRSGTPTSAGPWPSAGPGGGGPGAALAEAQAQVDGLEAERTRHGAPPDRDTLKGPGGAQRPQYPPRQPQAGGEPAGGGPGGRGGGPGLRRGSPSSRPDPRRGLGAGPAPTRRRRAAGPKQRGCTRAASCCWQWARWGS